MAEKSITIEITKDGQIKSTVHGVAGADCSKLAEWIDSLGEVTKDVHTDDFYKDANVVQVNKTR